MRVVDCRYFKVKAKIPFSDWTDIIHTYIDEQGLSYGNLYYYFNDLVSAEDSEEYDFAMKKGPCARAQRDCPAFGDIHHYRESEYTDVLYLSNIETPTGCTEQDILPLMKKLHKNYGFSQCDLYYADVNFFQQVMPAVKKCGKDLSLYKIDGSGIQLHRDCLGENYICLSVDVLSDGILLDSTPYFEAMKALLPGIKMTCERRVIFNEGEKRMFTERNKCAKPVVEKCVQFFEDHFPDGYSQNYGDAKYSCAQALRKCAKEMGFTYKKEDSYFYRIEKRTERGHVFLLEVASGPGNYWAECEVIFKGMGFEHSLGCCSYAPGDQRELEAFIRELMQIVKEVETGLLIELDACYPNTPEWYFL